MKDPTMNLLSRDLCPLCMSANRVTLLKRKFSDPAVGTFLESHYRGMIPAGLLAGDDLEIAKCVDCSFLWQAQILVPDLMDRLYSEWVPADESLSKKVNAEPALFQGYAREMITISHLLPKRPAETRVLDFGMGWGFWCLMAKAHGYDVTGLETSPPRLAYAQANGLRTAASIDALGGARFDFINSDQVFEHVPEPRETLAALSQLLVPGGYARIAVPNGSGIERGLTSPAWRAAKDAIHPLEHINCFTAATLKRLGAEAGLTAVAPPFTGLRALAAHWAQPTRMLFRKKGR